MIACLDVDYREVGAKAACVVVKDWLDGERTAVYTTTIDHIAPYEPGQFYKRELPCLLEVLDLVLETIDVLVVDGYVWLTDEDDPGLGAHLYKALGATIPIIGVAKTRYRQSHAAREVLRGESERPLYVTATGVDVDEAAEHIERMHGEFRLPTMVKLADHHARA